MVLLLTWSLNCIWLFHPKSLHFSLSWILSVWHLLSTATQVLPFSNWQNKYILKYVLKKIQNRSWNSIIFQMKQQQPRSQSASADFISPSGQSLWKGRLQMRGTHTHTQSHTLTVWTHTHKTRSGQMVVNFQLVAETNQKCFTLNTAQKAAIDLHHLMSHWTDMRGTSRKYHNHCLYFYSRLTFGINHIQDGHHS